MSDPFKYAHERRDEIIWMSQNNNLLPTTPAIDEALMESVKSREYALYPYNQGIFGLTEAVLDDLELDRGEYRALITPGGIEASYIATRALLKPGDEVLATDPSFLPIHHQIKLCEAKVVELPAYKEPWKFDLEELKEAVTDKTKMILLIDPLNPLGSAYTRDEVKAIADLAVDHDLYVIDDITYRDFADENVQTTEFCPERTVVTYSFSKNCGFAGMRIGAFAAPFELYDKLIPYNTNVLSVNILAQRGALAALETKKEWIGNVVETSRRNQTHIKEAVERVEGAFLPVYPSYTNMFVIDISGVGADPAAVQDELLYKHGIFVRSGGYVSKRFGANFIRVSFSIPEEQVVKFAEVLPGVLESLRK